MYDMTNLITRYFTIKFRNGLQLDVEPPKLKALKKILKVANVNINNLTDAENVFEDITEALTIALSKNKQNRKVTVDEIDDWLDIDEIIDLLNNYVEWIETINSSKN